MSEFQTTADRWLSAAIEFVVLCLVTLSPWAFGAVEPPHEFLLDAGIAILMGLWAARMTVLRQVAWKKCPVLLCLTALFLFGIIQLQPHSRELLSFFSPNTVQLSEEMMPKAPELLPSGESYARPPLSVGATVSLCPNATRQDLMRLLAVILLFAVMRNNLASPASFRRLSVALVINGSLLAFFAIFQFFTSPRDTVYWTFKTQGSVFGPFVSRTHFPFYVNVCIGAGIGLLLSLQSHDSQPGTDSDSEIARRGMLSDPRRMWLILALALMVGSVALSLSRGGVLAMVAASILLLMLRLPRRIQLARLAPVLLTIGAALVLVAWLGWSRVETRLATIWKGEALQQGRLPLWADSWPLVTEFPLLGTGYGTFMYVEPLHRSRTMSIFIHEHAHNEYLEALIEGGIVRLTISLLTIGLVYFFGYRAFRRHPDEPVGGLALGALFGFTAIVVHSIGDFGIHLPAIACLLTVLCAQLVSAGRDEAEESSTGGKVIQWRGAAPVVGALVAVTLALILWREGWRQARVHSFRLVAASLTRRTDPEGQARELALREGAARLAPNSARVLTELGEAHIGRYHARQRELSNDRLALEYTQLILDGAQTNGIVAQGWYRPSGLIGQTAWNLATAAEVRQLTKEHLEPALRAFLQARDVCPLLAKPQIRIGANRTFFQKADPRIAYIDRAKRVVTNDAELWFLFGIEELVEGYRDRAAESWHRSLELSDQYLLPVLQVGSQSLGFQALVEKVLPDRPEMLLTAAGRLYPDPKSANERKPLLERALTALDAQPQPLIACDSYLKARILTSLGRSRDAVGAYRVALELDPLQPGWRYELARVLVSEKRLEEARQDLLKALRQQPTFDQARELLRTVEREIGKD